MPNSTQDVTLVFRTLLADGVPSYSTPHAATVVYGSGAGTNDTGTVEPAALNGAQLAALGTQAVTVLLQAISPSPADFKNITNVVIGTNSTGTKPAFVLLDQPLPPISVETLLAYERSLGSN